MYNTLYKETVLKNLNTISLLYKWKWQQRKKVQSLQRKSKQGQNPRSDLLTDLLAVIPPPLSHSQNDISEYWKKSIVFSFYFYFCFSSEDDTFVLQIFESITVIPICVGEGRTVETPLTHYLLYTLSLPCVKKEYW